MKRKTRKRLAKEAALAKAEARGDFSHLKDKKGNLRAEPLGQPTLPNVDLAFEDDDKQSRFHAYPPGRGPPYPPPPMSDFGGSDYYPPPPPPMSDFSVNEYYTHPPPPMSDYNSSDFYRPRPNHDYTPSLASNDHNAWGPPPSMAGQSAASLVPHAHKGSDGGIDYHHHPE
jgi:hypothetical protein